MELLISESKAGLLDLLVDGRPKNYTYQGYSFSIAKHRDQLYAFESKCPHFDQNLEEAKLNFFQEIVCPWHGYRFSLKNGQESDQRCRPLKLYEISIKEDGVYLSLDL